MKHRTRTFRNTIYKKRQRDLIQFCVFLDLFTRFGIGAIRIRCAMSFTCKSLYFSNRRRTVSASVDYKAISRITATLYPMLTPVVWYIGAFGVCFYNTYLTIEHRGLSRTTNSCPDFVPLVLRRPIAMVNLIRI